MIPQPRRIGWYREVPIKILFIILRTGLMTGWMAPALIRGQMPPLKIR